MLTTGRLPALWPRQSADRAPAQWHLLIDKQGIVRYIHQVTNPQASLKKRN